MQDPTTDADAARDTEIVMVFGGDGTFLRAAELARFTDAALMGVNLGRVGFLAETEPEAVEETLQAIERAIEESERTHSGEVRFAIEAALEPGEVWAGRTPRQRALEVFSALGVWDTEANNGILIYLLLADRDVEIVADRGFNGKVSAAEWSAVCGAMEQHLRLARYEEASIDGVVAEIAGPVDAVFSCAGLPGPPFTDLQTATVNFIGARALLQGLLDRGKLPEGSADCGGSRGPGRPCSDVFPPCTS